LRTVAAAKPAAAEYIIWDDGVPGFGLKMTPAGGRIYLFQYRLARPGEAKRTPPRKYTIGKHGALTPDQARARAKELAAMVAQGVDPRRRELDLIGEADEARRNGEERKRLENELAFSTLAPLFLDWYENERRRRSSSVALARLVVNRYLLPALADKPLPHIGRGDLQPIIDGIPSEKRGVRRAVFVYASVLFSWAMKQRGIIAENPLRAMAKPAAPEARERVLADDELADLWRATHALAPPFGAFFRLLTLTAQRRSEVAGLRWEELNREAALWTLPAARAKNGKAHLVPLSAVVVAELDTLALAGQVKAGEPNPEATRWPTRGYVLTTTGRTPISGITKAKNALDKAAAGTRGSEAEPTSLDGWRIHDLRRTAATGFQALGIRFEVAESVLNHKSGAKGGVSGIYMRFEWQDEKRSALEAWANRVVSLGQTAVDNIVPLRREA
jgi:integrase